jgi:hypothetical protein
MNRIASALLAATVLLAASIAPVAAEAVRLEITGKTAYGTFRPGEYVLWRGKVHGELAPTEAIPDLDKATRNEGGKVEYSADIMLLMPADPSKGNGTLLVDIPNRGRVYGIALYNGPRGEPFNSGNIQQGTGFLEDRGFSLAEVQWELGKGVELPSFTGADGKTRYVEGAGFAIVRDTADFLAQGAVDAAGTPNPLRGAIDHVLASGKSQSGRFLKTFLLNGFNKVNGHRVVDGMHIFVSGAGLLPILTSSPGPQSSADAAPSFGDPEFRGVHEGPFTIGEIVAGNVLGGVRLPDMAAPLGVHAAQQEPKSFGCSLAGAFLPFSEARIAERYKNRDDYVNQIRVAARTLQAERLLLPEDAAVIVNAAAAMPWPPSGQKK